MQTPTEKQLAQRLEKQLTRQTEAIKASLLQVYPTEDANTDRLVDAEIQNLEFYVDLLRGGLLTLAGLAFVQEWIDSSREWADEMLTDLKKTAANNAQGETA